MIFTAIAFLAGIVLSVLESTFLDLIEIAGTHPDIAVLIAVVAASRADSSKALILAFMLGITRDFFSWGAVGMNAFAITFMAYTIMAAQDFLITDNWSAQIFVTFVGAAIFGALFMALTLVVGFELPQPARIFALVIGTAAYTSVFAPLAFLFAPKPHLPEYMRLKMRYGSRHETLPPTEV